MNIMSDQIFLDIFFGAQLIYSYCHWLYTVIMVDLCTYIQYVFVKARYICHSGYKFKSVCIGFTDIPTYMFGLFVVIDRSGTAETTLVNTFLS